MFYDRTEAGTLLAAKLKKYEGSAGVILAVPRGGVPVAYAVAKTLGLRLDIVLTKKIGHPLNKEYAIGAISSTDFFVIPHADVSEEYINAEVERLRRKLQEMYQKFMGDKEPPSIKGKIVIVIDDGIATGNTLLGTVNMLRKSKPARIVIAAPVASKKSVEMLSQVVDEVIVVLIPEVFRGVGAFYNDFEQVSDEEVMYYLDKWKKEIKQAG